MELLLLEGNASFKKAFSLRKSAIKEVNDWVLRMKIIFPINILIWRITLSGLVEIYDLKSKEWTKGSQSYPEDTWEHACVALHIPSCRTEDSTDLNLK